MNGLKKICTSALLLFSFFMGEHGIAQLAIGQWRDHLSYKKGIAITQNTNKIFCATESGIFQIEKFDYSIDRLSKISGLSDVSVSTLRYNEYNSSLLIAYKNANIDIVKDKAIYNISDIKRKLITAKKTINNIYYLGGIAYLACGFGIVVLDMDKREIKDTYYIGVNNGYINVRDITSDANYLYAATDSGVYRAAWNSPNLSDYNYWKKFIQLPKGVYNSIAALNGRVYTNLSSNSSPPYPYKNDTIYAFDGSSWIKPIPDSVYANGPLRKMEVCNNELVISFAYSVDFFDATGTWTGKRIGAFVTGFLMEPKHAIVDKGDAKTVWIADYMNGVIKNYDTWGGSVAMHPNGPNTSQVYSMAMSNEDLWVARGNRSETWGNVYNEAEAYRFSNESWSTTNKVNIPMLDSIRDIVSVAIDPKDKQHIYLGSLGAGLVEINNGALVALWNETNSSLQSTGLLSTYHWVSVFGLSFDSKGNLWATNSTAANPLSVRKTDGTWQSFNFSAFVTNPTVGQVLINQYDQKWIVLARGAGILVFDENGTWSTGDDKAKKLSTGKGNGNLPSNEVQCIAEDHDGEIWIGTDKGIAVFYCPEQVFSSSGCDAQQIFIEQDGHTQILLETEIVTAIAVDGANRKWIGTQNSGVYLMSADGTTQIRHFSVDNSPLLTNEIQSIVINPKTGEVFFGTTEGIISYRNDATEGLEDYTNVYVFPNPVQPGYEGPIAITGLVESVNVKITDISGALVYNTKALGGQAIWYGKNFKGEKVSSGVYLVFCSNEDGSKTYITKILLVN